ncbi:MAG: helix-turn-helix transcriptional regulator [Phycisphaerae bacterium]|nr:helix-turn-helix transcriptional regulator [Phycisphaerae bacterium]
MVIATNWDYENEEEKKKMEEEVTKENCGEKLNLIRKKLCISRKELAKTLGVRESTIGRLERIDTHPSQDFMRRLHGLQLVGYAAFKKLSDADKEKISEFIGTGAGVAGGVAGSIAAISAAGSIGGLSAAGITSGLAAIGGSMLGGIIVTGLIIPLAAGAIGLGAIKGIKKICEANNLSCEEFDDHWEIKRDNEKEDKEV